jgi:nicotinamidase-related amidase
VTDPALSLLSREASVLLLIDLQEKLLPAISGWADLVPRAALILEAAKVLGIPVVVTEQYPQGLGPTVEAIRRELPPGTVPLAKTTFSCVSEPGIAATLAATKRSQVVIAGIETHVCVAQTALELAAGGWAVSVAADATGSRRAGDRDAALERMRRAGIVITTAEAVTFEWLRRAGTPEFKAIQRRLKAT